jgi:hypothetical protein
MINANKQESNNLMIDPDFYYNGTNDLPHSLSKLFEDEEEK